MSGVLVTGTEEAEEILRRSGGEAFTIGMVAGGSGVVIG